MYITLAFDFCITIEFIFVFKKKPCVRVPYIVVDLCRVLHRTRAKLPRLGGSSCELSVAARSSLGWG